MFVCGGYVICHHVTRIGADHADLGDWVRVSEHRAFATDEPGFARLPVTIRVDPR